MTSNGHVDVVYLAHPLGGDVDANAADPDSMPEYRARCLRDDLAIAARCHGIVLCGGRISPGMQQEADACVAAGGFIIDLTGFSEEPSHDARVFILNKFGIKP